MDNYPTPQKQQFICECCGKQVEVTLDVKGKKRCLNCIFRLVALTAAGVATFVYILIQIF